MIDARVKLLADPDAPWTEDAENTFQVRNFECLWPAVRAHFGQLRTAGISYYKNKGDQRGWTLVKQDKPVGSMEVHAKW